MNKTPVFWIIAGTTEGRKLAEELSSYEALVYVSLATEYGKWFLQEKENLLLIAKRLNKEEMTLFILENKIECVIDTTHPYAHEVTKNIFEACQETKTRYLRLLRPSGEEGDFIYAEDSKQAAAILTKTPGKIFLTCGSKEIEKFTVIPDFQNRIFIRILPEPKMLQKSIDLGFKPPNIICMQGPFSTELNVAMLKATGAEILVTKDSGTAGGFREKIEAANQLGIPVIVIGRPTKEEGFTYEEVVAMLQNEYNLRFDFSH